MEASPLAPSDGTSSPHRPLQAGPFSLLLDAGDLRYVTWGGREVIRRIYAAVRNHDWNTVPGVISDLDVRTTGMGFHVRYVSTHRQDDIHFVWRADIQGGDDGSIRFTFDGEAKSAFRRNRIGFCVLHPSRECAGARCRARYANGTERELCFPDTIAAEQPVKWLHDLAGLDHEVAPGVWAELDFVGDLFEMEDQRNWIDASFKTFCTPLRLPFPMEIKAGTRVRQEVRLRIVEQAPPASGASGPMLRTQADAAVTVRVQGDGTPLPAIGLGMASHGQPLLADEVNQLRILRPAHLRVDLRPWEASWRQQLDRAAAEAGPLAAKLEVALHLDVAPEAGLPPMAEALAGKREELARVLVFHRHQESTTLAALRAARVALAEVLPGVPIGAGTDADLYQLNLQRPPAEADLITWSMNPQVHAFDDASIAETPEGAAHQLNSVHRYFPGKPLVVSPITLRPRFNPYATGPAPALPAGELPSQVDPRQLSLFAAAWTLAMIKSVAESGAASVTFYETTGWRGVMETPAGSPLPAKFPSVPGAVFPLYHVLADVTEFAGGEVSPTLSSDPLAVASLFLRKNARRRLLLANLSRASRKVRLDEFSGIVSSRSLDASISLSAMNQPKTFRAEFTPVTGPEITLPPHAVVTLDFFHHNTSPTP
ncbi:MAG: hypothetical protein FJ404_13570 [Verrucomicrobia bacterium]|nr:hypothetical protein [Verrucomicrobiota bacterium]